MSEFPQAVSIREVGPRDGLQNEPPVDTQGKIDLINALSRTGVGRIEAVSFVHPRAIPQMADASEVWNGIDRVEGVTYSALVPNVKGLTRALDAGFTEIEVVVSASDTHNQKNIARPTAESVAGLEELIGTAHDAGAVVECIISTSFGCPYEGDVDPAAVASIAESAVSFGADRIACGDTTGMATPLRVRQVVERLVEKTDVSNLLMHFHNTRGTALANIMESLRFGITQFDASVGGLGGCPYAPGASGNVATEEVVHMLEDMGISTGIDLDALLGVAEMAKKLVGHDLPSGVFKAGPRTRLTPTN